MIWGYQQPAFVAAGYRVIAYSRRGYYNSDPVPKDNPGIGSQDLHHLTEFLGIKKFHVIASAGGVGIAIDYALSHPQGLLSMVLANGTGISQGAAGIRDADYVASLADSALKASTTCRSTSANCPPRIVRSIPRASGTGSSSITRRSAATGPGRSLR